MSTCGFQQKLLYVVTLVIVVSALLRLIPSSPPGFFIDEAAIAAQILCFQQSGHNLQGVDLPIFTPVLGGGYLTPTYLYPASAWVSVFGGSIGSFRTFAATASIIFLFGVFLFARRFWGSREAAWLSTLSAAISPWAFQFSKISWDPAIAPALLAWSFVFLWRKRNWDAALAGVFFSLAAYSYPPLRVQIAIILPLALILLWYERRELRRGLTTIATATLVSVPLIYATWTGEIQGRFSLLSVFNPDFLQQAYGNASFSNAISAILENFGALLSLNYLFIHGDSNLRHSTGNFGIWSWIDAIAIMVALFELARRLIKRNHDSNYIPALFLFASYLAGLLPAALTWESNPHALRSIGALFFLTIASGGALLILWRYSSWGKMLIAVTGIVFLVSFQRDFFGPYRERSELWFDKPISELAVRLGNSGQIANLESEIKNSEQEYDPMALAYYHLYFGFRHCAPKK